MLLEVCLVTEYSFLVQWKLLGCAFAAPTESIWNTQLKDFNLVRCTWKLKQFKYGLAHQHSFAWLSLLETFLEQEWEQHSSHPVLQETVVSDTSFQ